MEENQNLLEIARRRLEKDRKEKNFFEIPFSEKTLRCMEIICFLDSLRQPEKNKRRFTHVKSPLNVQEVISV